MDIRSSELQDQLETLDVDGFLVEGGGRNSDQRYLSRFAPFDPFLTLFDADMAKTHLLIWGSDEEQGKLHSRADVVYTPNDFGVHEIILSHESHDTQTKVVNAFLDELGIGSLAIDRTFPVGRADTLRDEVEVTVTDGLLLPLRARKTADEIEAIRRAQAATDAAFRRVHTLLETAHVTGDVVSLDGEVLTIEQVVTDIQMTLFEFDCFLEGSPVFGVGAATADPHVYDSGPLRPDVPILIDLGPMHKATGYHADMTRTFVKGTPSPEIEDAFALVEQALEAAVAMIEPGVSAAAVNDRVCDIFEEAGYTTLRTQEDPESGYLHYTGHGIGLDIHESPHCSPNGGQLEEGNVITIEPGLYRPDTGGVRIEDTIVVTSDGCRNITAFPRRP